MRIKKYTQFLNESYKELEYELDDTGTNDMMYQCSAIFNLLRNFDQAAQVISDTLTEEIYEKLFGRYTSMIRRPSDLVNLFTTTVINHKDLKKMFKNVTIQEGADMEDEYVAALEINGKQVLLLHSPERGSSIRIQDDNHSIKEDEVIEILRELCKIYNEKL
jgi:hypothetical protein